MRMIRFVVAGACLPLLTLSCAAPSGPEFRNVASMYELMEGMVGPVAQVVFDSVRTIVDENGTTEIRPSTPEEWDEVFNATMGLAESANILLMEAHSQEGEWNTFALAMQDAALEAADAVRAQDPERLFDAGGVIFQSCDGCHTAYIPAAGQ